MATRSLLLIQVGTPPDPIRATTGDIPAWFVDAVDDVPVRMDVVEVYKGHALPEPGQHDAALITGSWSMVTDRHDWSEATAAWIRRAVAAGMPVMGVCYGHQLMAHALGGTVDYHPEGREMGCLDVALLPTAQDDPWLHGCPDTFKANLTHSQSVLALPPGAVALARSAHDPHQAVRYAPHAVSVQFHPEITPAILAACIRQHDDDLRAEGFDTAALLDGLVDTPTPQTLLQRFVQGHGTGTPGRG